VSFVAEKVTVLSKIGGVKGMFSLRVLERLVAKFPRLIDEVDLIAGTSTGGLIALMLANGYSPTQGKKQVQVFLCIRSFSFFLFVSKSGLEIYRHNIPLIFHSNVFRRLAPFLSTYPDRYREEVYRYYFNNLKLSDLGKFIVITAFRLDGGPDLKGKRRTEMCVSLSSHHHLY
jgi:patatin-like phospholipase/acyl hydrolase